MSDLSIVSPACKPQGQATGRKMSSHERQNDVK